MHLTLFAKIAIMLLASIAAVVLPVLYTVHSALSDVFLETLHNNLNVSAFTLEEELTGYKNAIAAILWQGARRDDLRRAVADKDLSALRDILGDMQNNSVLDMITLSDAEGTVIMRSHSPKAGDNVSRQINVRRSQAGTPLTVGYEGGTAVAFSIRGGAPIYCDNRLVGVLTIGIRLDQAARVEALKHDLGAEVTFFKGNVRIATSLVDEKGRSMAGTTLDDPAVQDSVLRRGEPYVKDGLKLGGRPYSAIYKPLKDAEGGNIGMLFLGVPSSWLDAVLNGLMTNILLMAGVVALLMSLIGILGARWLIVRPLARVSSVVRDLVEDKAELSYRFDTSSKDEVAHLAHEVNRLIGKVEHMLSNIEGYRDLVNAIPDPVFTVNEQYRILMANARLARVSGGENPEALVGKHINEVLHTNIYGSPNCPMRESMFKKTRALSDIFPLQVRGRTRMVRGLSDVVRDVHGNIIGYLQITSDVTERVEQEKQLEAQMERLSEVNRRVTGIAVDVDTSARRIQEQTDAVKRAAEEQNVVMRDSLNAIEQMNHTITEIARAASNASSQADACRKQAAEGEDTVQQAMRAIASARDLSENVNRDLGQLGSQADEIGQVLNMISDIADQTNLLALNAAIEAARAGDAGRGFAVVADEVRKLAEKTMGATQEVRKAVTDIQKGTASYIAAMGNVSEAVEKASALSENSGRALNEIVSQVRDTAGQADSIAAAAEEQSSASQQIASGMNRLAELADNTLRQSQETAATMRELLSLAENLNESVK